MRFFEREKDVIIFIKFGAQAAKEMVL